MKAVRILVILTTAGVLTRIVDPADRKLREIVAHSEERNSEIIMSSIYTAIATVIDNAIDNSQRKYMFIVKLIASTTVVCTQFTYK